MKRHLTETTGLRRLGYAAAVGGLVFAAATPLAPPVRLLLAWVAAGATDLCLAWLLARHFEAPRIRGRAKAQDESAAVLFLAMVVALCASVVAIVVLLQQTRDLPQSQRGAHVALSMLAVATSWLWIHTLFAFRYAHRYYQGEDGGPEAAEAQKAASGGLDFPGEGDPDYFDFLYQALVIGMTSQVSDVQVTSSAMRRLVTVHGLMAFVFNVVLLALGVNAAASMLG
ncbi:DUF1345 domain-containing protein [Xylophilus ampelinus]|uniref:DUF1345 domain-containing protein n=1 Tax=Xylophilus ampelinus TaxID=54067 RepID=UPI000D7CAF74|nr:DUF1345 domain-containing protein [Xylophilus ampelinus]MCS4509206.1 DUF1345 domain-containing protein [Xylophilus ampelinus]